MATRETECQTFDTSGVLIPGVSWSPRKSSVDTSSLPFLCLAH